MSLGDAEDIKRAIQRMLAGPEFVAALQATVTEKGDGQWPKLPVTVYRNERMTHDTFPMAELLAYTTSYDEDDDVKNAIHRVGVRWTDVGPTEEAVTMSVERLTRSTTDLLWMSNLDTLVKSGPIRVTTEDYSPLLPTPQHPFVKSSVVMLNVPVWRE